MALNLFLSSLLDKLEFAQPGKISTRTGGCLNRAEIISVNEVGESKASLLR